MYRLVVVRHGFTEGRPEEEEEVSKAKRLAAMMREADARSISLKASINDAAAVQTRVVAARHIGYRSHFGSRYKLGCCGHAGLFCTLLIFSP